MKKTMLILPLTAALLAACGSTTPIPVTLNTLTVGGVTGPLKIEAPAKLTVTATGTDGIPFTAPASFTSSDPNVVAVAADGTLTVRHLTTRPVTLTVTEAGKTASLDVTTYGLDFAPGTYNSGTTSGIAFTTRFVDSAGNGVTTDSPVTYTGPAGFNNGAPSNATYPAILKTGSGQITLAVAPVSGTYTAILTTGGVTYSKTATLDATSLLPTPKGVTAVPTTQNVTFSGTLPVGATRVGGFAYSNASKAYVASSSIRGGTLPSTLPWNTPIAPGDYGLLIVTRVYFGTDNSTSGDPMPDQANASYVYLPSVTIN
jgi:hypothetical protein